MKNKKIFYYVIFAFLIWLSSFINLILNYSWKVFIPIFGIIYSVKILEKYKPKNNQTK